MKRLFVALAMCCAILASGIVAGAQESRKDEEMVSVPKSMLTADQVARVEARNLEEKIQTYGKWVGLGKEVGGAVNESLTAITEQTAKFADTRVGKFTMFLIAWKVLGTDLIQLVVGILFFFIWIPLWVWSFHANALKRRVLKAMVIPKEGDKQYNYEVINYDDNATAERVVHVVVFLILAIANYIVLFA